MSGWKLIACCLLCWALPMQGQEDVSQPLEPVYAPAGDVEPAISAQSPSDKAEQDAHQAAQEAEQVQTTLQAVREVLDIGLSGEEAGELLREARQRAPEPDTVAAGVNARERQIARARLDRVRLLERRRFTNDEAERAALTDQLAAQEDYLHALDTALVAERTLATQSLELATLLNSRLLWIGSAAPLGREWLTEVAEGVRWVTGPDAWVNLGRRLLVQSMRNPVPVLLVAFLVVLLAISHRRFKARLTAQAAGLNRFATDGFGLTLRALLFTLLLALPLPLALAGLGTLLTSGVMDRFSYAVGQGLLAAAVVCLAIDFFRQVCRSGGLADAHFAWNPRARKLLWHHLSWLLVIESAAALVVATCDAGGDVIYANGLGRLVFMVGALGLTVFVAVVFRPQRGVFTDLMARGGWTWRLRRLWYATVVFLPAAHTIAAARGYYYSASELQSRFFLSGLVVLGAVVLFCLLTRWLSVSHRRLAMKQALEKLMQQREARRVKLEAGETDPSVDAVDFNPQEVDVEAVSSQTLSLLKTFVVVAALAGLWAIWSQLLPALSVLDRVELTPAPRDAQGVILGEPLTLWSLVKGLLAAVLTCIAVRNLPALIELVVLHRFPLMPGTRYAATMLTRYAVIAVGVVVTSLILHIDWSRAQWIIAALGVGLGFGLQEIVANFVSGLIILFERPVRVGDTVTVGGVSGTVSRLQIRATTIIDGENKEVLVPNKSFITNPVVNWTLSNSVTRLTIPLRIGRDSDIAQVHRVISEAIKSVPTVLDNPAPSVFFVGFGDTWLNFEVSISVSELSKRMPTQDEVNSAINTALRSAGF